MNSILTRAKLFRFVKKSLFFGFRVLLIGLFVFQQMPLGKVDARAGDAENRSASSSTDVASPLAQPQLSASLNQPPTNSINPRPLAAPLTWTLSYTTASTSPSARSLGVYNGMLYASAHSLTQSNAKLYRFDGTSWVDLDISTKVGVPVNMIESLEVFNGLLYIGVRVNVSSACFARIYRYDGSSFAQDFSDTGACNMSGISDMTVHNNILYAANGSVNGRVYQRIADNNWVQLGDTFSYYDAARTLASFQGDLYLGSGVQYGKVWKWTGSTWNLVKNLYADYGININGVWEIIPFKNKLYVTSAGSVNPSPIYAFDGSTWVLSKSISNTAYSRLALANNKLWAIADRGQVFMTEDGVTWSSMGGAGSGHVYDLAQYGNYVYAATEDGGIGRIYRAGSIPVASISGRVTNAVGEGIPNVSLSDGAGHTATTDGSGYYTFSGLEIGSYSITPLKAAFSFSPGKKEVQNTGLDISNVNFTGSTSLTITHMEVTQGIQDEINSVKPIAYKQTVVRVYVDCGVACDSIPFITGVLRAYRSEGSYLGQIKPNPDFITATHNISWTTQRGSPRGTLNFELPIEWTVGNIDLVVEVNDSLHFENSLSFHAAKPLKIAYIRVEQIGFSYIADSEVIKPGKADSFLNKFLPIANNGVEYYQLEGTFKWAPPNERCNKITFETDKEKWEENKQECYDIDLIQYLNRLYKPDYGDILFGWLPSNGIIKGGRSDPAWYTDPNKLKGTGNVGFATASGSVYSKRALVHEVGHLLGAHHTNTGECRDKDDKTDWPIEYEGSARIHDWGLDPFGLFFPNTWTYLTKDPTKFWDYMSYCDLDSDSSIWVSPHTYNKTYDYRLNPDNTNLTIAGLGDELPYYYISGMVFKDDSAYINPIWVVSSSTSGTNPQGSIYCLETQDINGTAIAQSCFDMGFINPETGASTSVDGFTLMLPKATDDYKIVLKKGSLELASQTISTNSPEVAITSPNGGETWDATGDYTISWDANDLDGDSLIFDVSYSLDGVEWFILGSNLTETSLTVNAADLPGSDNALIRVTATDGVNTTSDESDLPFSISRKGPQVIIASPSVSETTVGSGQLLLQGSAYDLEDGPLADSSLTWSSSIDGALGTGSNLLVNLTPGSHTIILTAVDADVTSATSEVTINVNTCYALQLDHTGDGSDPVASPAYSEICPTGMYVAGESIQLSGAQPAVAFLLTGWTGTADDSSTATTNSLVMPAADIEVSVNYTPDTNTYSISGTVKTSSGSGVSGVTIDDGSGHSILTDEDGNFALTNLGAGNITLTPQKDGLAFTPSSRSTVLGPDATDFDFVQNNKIPVLAELVPAYLYRSNTAATLTISGSDFGSDSVVRLAGVDQATTYIDSAHLSISLTPSDAADLGKVDVTVFNPAPEGGLSNEISLPILAFSPLVDQKLASSKVSFAWGAIPDATGYTLQLSLNSSFSTTLVNTATTSPNYSYGTALTNAKTYYWRVRPKYGSVLGDWSPTWSFFSKNPPAAPTVVLPASAAYLHDNTPTLSWNSVTNGNKYHLQISKSSSFGVLERDLTLDAGILEATITSLADGLYYWRVQALDSVDVAGAWSSVRTFAIDTLPPAAPILSAPLEGVTVRGTPLYKWSAPAGAKTYQFLYGSNPNCSFPAFTSARLATTSYTPPTQPVGTYTWCVKSFDAAGNESPLSSPRSLTIQPLVPVGPGLVSPASSALTNDNTPALTWNPVPYGVRYRIQVSRSSSFPSTSILQTIETDGELTADLSMLPDGKYYWRVQAQNIDLVWGSWSSYRAFTIDTLPPTIPVMTSPLNNSSVLTPTPKLVVATATGAKYYRFQVNTSNVFSDPLVDVKGTAIYYTLLPAQALPFGSAWWRVKTIDAAGNESNWSSPTQFTVTILKSPVSGSYTVKTKPVFTWASVSGAKQYQLQVDDNADFSSPIDTITRPVSTTYTFLFDLPYAKYYWRMQVNKGAGFMENWTPALPFTVTPPLPLAPQLISPASGFTTAADPILSWNLVAGSPVGIKGYEIQISKSSSFITLERSGILDVLTYTPTGLTLGKYYWRVRAINDLDVPGAWAPYRSFTLIP